MLFVKAASPCIDFENPELDRLEPLCAQCFFGPLPEAVAI